MLLQDFGANPDQVIELCGLTEHYHIGAEDGWTDEMEVPLPARMMAKAKARPSSGYRGDEL